MSQQHHVHSLPSCTYYGSYVPCSPYTPPEYRVYSSRQRKLLLTPGKSTKTQALVYSLFGAIGYSRNILKDLVKNGDIGELQTGTAKDYIHNQSNDYPNGYDLDIAQS